MLHSNGSVKGILKNSGFKDIAFLSSGVLLAQVISFFCQPIATRLYSPEDFGTLSIITSTVSVLTPLLTLQYHMGIVSANTDKEANIVSALSFYTIVFMSFLITVSLFVYNLIFPTTFKSVGNWIYVVIPLLVLSGIGNIVDSYNNRFQQYKLMSSIALLRSISSNVFKLVLGLFNPSFLGLIISYLVSVVFGIRKQGQYILEKYKEILLYSNIRNLKNTAVKYKVQPLFSLPGIFVTTFSFSILPILINSLFSIKEAGYFSMAFSILGLPLSLVSNNVAKVFFRRASLERQQSGKFLSTFKSTSTVLIIIAIPGFTILWFIAEPLFSYFLGHEWLRSGTYIRILAPLFAIRLIVSSLMHGFIISGRQSLKLFIQMMFILELIPIFVISKLEDIRIEQFLELINIAYSITYIILFIVLYFTSKQIDE